MKRILFAVLPALALAACSGEDAASTTTAAAPVAAAPAPAGQNWADTVVATPEGGFRMGNPNAAIKLVEYGSRTCHVCQEFDAAATEPLTRDYIATGKVSFEFRDFLRNGADLAASLVGQCGGPGPFFPILHQMYAVQPQTLATAESLGNAFYESLAALPPAQQPARFAEAMGYLDFVKQRGITDARARACLADTAKGDALAKATEDASREYSISGTPTFLINGRVVPNTVNWQQVETALKAAGA